MNATKSDTHCRDWSARGARKWLLRAAGLAAAFSMLIGPSIARADDISYLGPLAEAYPGMYEPIILQAAKPAAPTKGKVQVILFDTLWDNSSAAGRWPIVKLLDQFGTWTGLAPGAAMGIVYPAFTGLNGIHDPACPPMPTYDLSHASYSSKYVTFTHRVVQSKKNSPHAHLSAADQALFNKILRMPAYTMAGNAPLTGSGDPGPLNTVLDLPAVAIGRYGVHGSGMPIRCPLKSGEDEFVEIRQLILHPGDVFFGAELNMNVFINTLIAGICRQDGGRPAGVCGLRSVKYILTRLK
jgi:hypothetical protein